MKLAGIALVMFSVAACSGKPEPVEPGPALPGETRAYQLFVVSHGWHTGLIVPGNFLTHAIPELKERFGDAAYYEIGWGDKGFYQAREITARLTLQAMFWSESAIMHVVAVPADVQRYFAQSEVLRTCLTQGQMSSLSTFVSKSLARDSQGKVVRLTQGIYGNSQFYGGEGRYHLLNTCNTWTAKGLQSAGLDLSPSLHLLSGSVMASVRSVQQECSLTPPQSMAN